MYKCIYDSNYNFRNLPIFCLIDIDLFKSYNTHLGYEKADLKLIELAKLFKELEVSS